MADTTYNGWTNYETWAVNLWLENDQGTRESIQEIATTADSIYDLQGAIRDEVEENGPDLGASMYADLLNAAFSEINYYEIAEHLWEDTHDNA